ncbi:MAG: hypothetical protein V4801_02655 [Burkholderia gladioli]
MSFAAFQRSFDETAVRRRAGAGERHPRFKRCEFTMPARFFAILCHASGAVAAALQRGTYVAGTSRGLAIVVCLAETTTIKNRSGTSKGWL